MPEPPPRRKPATELELRVARGDPTARDALIELLDATLHQELFRRPYQRLPDDERSRIVVDVIADFLNGVVTYDIDQAAITTIAKRRAKQRAIDWFRRQKAPKRWRSDLSVRASLSLKSPVLLDDAIRREQVDRLMIEIELLPQNQRRAAHAWMKHGDSDPARGGKSYATILGDELGVVPNVVAQWWHRARRRLEFVLTENVASESKRSG